jgi:hypothetical protein
VTRFFAHNRALIQLHKQHQSYFAQAFLDCAFQLGKNADLAKAKALQRPKRPERPAVIAIGD